MARIPTPVLILGCDMTPEQYIRNHAKRLAMKGGLDSKPAEEIAEEVIVKYRRSPKFKSKDIIDYVTRQVKARKNRIPRA